MPLLKPSSVAKSFTMSTVLLIGVFHLCISLLEFILEPISHPVALSLKVSRSRTQTHIISVEGETAPSASPWTKG